jgi:hypothetical protein
MPARFQTPNQQFFAPDGTFLSGGLLYFYLSGTSTPSPTFSDQALTIPNLNPVVLDADGYAGAIFLVDGVSYKVVLTDSNMVEQWTEDPVGSTTSETAVTGTLVITGPVDTVRAIDFQTSGAPSGGNRFDLDVDGAPESGSNAGSNFNLNSYDDAGVLLSRIFTVNRATGILDFAVLPTVNSQALAAALAPALVTALGGQLNQAGAIIPAAMPFAFAGTLLCDGTTYPQANFPNLYNYLVRQATVTLSLTSPGLVNWPAHGLPARVPVSFSTTGALPTGITAGTTYYVVSPTTNSFNIATTPTGSAIAFSGSQSGVQTGICAPYGFNSTNATFNVPYFGGTFLRAFDTVGGNDPNSAFGMFVADSVQNHNHGVGPNAAGAGAQFMGAGGGAGGPLAGGGSFRYSEDLTTGAMASGNAGSETAPKNVPVYLLIVTG